MENKAGSNKPEPRVNMKWDAIFFQHVKQMIERIVQGNVEEVTSPQHVVYLIQKESEPFPVKPTCESLDRVVKLELEGKPLLAKEDRTGSTTRSPFYKPSGSNKKHPKTYADGVIHEQYLESKTHKVMLYTYQGSVMQPGLLEKSPGIVQVVFFVKKDAGKDNDEDNNNTTKKLKTETDTVDHLRVNAEPIDWDNCNNVEMEDE